jgi:glucokinase
MMPDKVLCYDMGGRRIRAAVATRERILCSIAHDIPVHCTNDQLCRMALKMGQEVLKTAHAAPANLLGIGFGAAGEWDGLLILSSPNNPVRHDITVAECVRHEFMLPTIGANDLRAAVHAVPVYGHGRGKHLDVVAAITFSDGNNIAILNNGRPYPGYSDVSQEVGHAHIEHGPAARWCGCGARGCFEAYVSGTAAAGMAIEALWAHRNHLDKEPIFQVAKQALTKKHKGPGKLRSDDILLGVRAEHVYAALKDHNDPIARWVCETQKFYIAHQLAHVSLHHRPQLIELFGGLTNQARLVFEPAIADLAAQPTKYTYPEFVPPEIRVTTLGDDIGLYGAASMVFLAKEAGTLK